jgi:hypothetical protein
MFENRRFVVEIVLRIQLSVAELVPTQPCVMLVACANVEL